MSDWGQSSLEKKLPECLEFIERANTQKDSRIIVRKISRKKQKINHFKNENQTEIGSLPNGNQ